MAMSATTVNNSYDDFVLNSLSENLFENFSISKTPSVKPDFSNINPKFLKHMEMLELSEKANELIASIGKTIVFANETYHDADNDLEGSKESYYMLYVIFYEETDEMTFSRLKFSRKAYSHGSSKDSINYCQEKTSEADDHLFDAMLHFIHSNDEDENENEEYCNKEPIYNTEPSYLSIPGKTTLAKLQEGLEETDKIIFIGENYEYGDCDRHYGPLETYISLYIFVKKTDGTIIHHKFYREYHIDDGDDDDDVPYEDAAMHHYDFERKYFVYE